MYKAMIPLRGVRPPHASPQTPFSLSNGIYFGANMKLSGSVFFSNCVEALKYYDGYAGASKEPNCA